MATIVIESSEAAAAFKHDFEARFATAETHSPETPGASHFGTSNVRWLDNLLYLYTKRFDIVVITFVSGETVS